MFMIRQASYVYGMHGASLWVLATDVRRFRPLIVFNGISFTLAAASSSGLTIRQESLVLDHLRYVGVWIVWSSTPLA